jgi:hypothetical protein
MLDTFIRTHDRGIILLQEVTKTIDLRSTHYRTILTLAPREGERRLPLAKVWNCPTLLWCLQGEQ